MRPRQRARAGYGGWQLVSPEPLEPRQVLAGQSAIGPDPAHVRPSGDLRIDALLDGSKWNTNTITYSFYSGGRYYGDEVNPQPLSENARNSIRSILSDVIQPIINVTFREVPDSPTSYGLIRYLAASMEDAAGYAYSPYGDSKNAGTALDVDGDVILNRELDVPAAPGSPAEDGSFQTGPGFYGFMTAIHETLHAMGLKHPGRYNVGGGTLTGPFLPLSQDNSGNTVMTYNNVVGSSPVSPMPYDVLALQYLYGARTTTQAGNTTYTFSRADAFTPNAGTPLRFGDRNASNTLWDGGGTDTLDFSAIAASKAGYRIDLRGGGWITPTNVYQSTAYDAAIGPPTTFSVGTTYPITSYGTRIAFGTSIENVVMSPSSDTLFLNAAANRVSGYRPAAANGNDVIYVSNQFDSLDLTAFGSSDVARTRKGSDLVLGLGGSGSVTIKGYFDSYPWNRMRIDYASVTVAATDANAAEGVPGDTATYTLTRTGATAEKLTVNVSLGGTATNGLDYRTIPTKVTFAAGSATATVCLTVIDDVKVEGTESAVLRILPGEGYAVGAASTATVSIADNDGRGANRISGGGGAAIRAMVFAALAADADAVAVGRSQRRTKP